MHTIRWVSLACAVVVIAACGGGGGEVGSGGGGGGGGGTVVSEASKLSLIKAIGPQIKSWWSLPKATRHTNLVAWAKKQPNVADAGIAPETNNVWIQFADGDATMYIDNRTPNPPNRPQRILPKKNDMPGDIRATTMWSLQVGHFTDVTDSIRLDLANQGYTSSRIAYPTIEQLLALNGSGVLFWQTHSGICTDKRNGVVRTRWAFVTGQTPTVELGTRYKAYRDSGELFVAGIEAYNADGTPKDEPDPAYAITDLFITNHMRLADNAFVAIDSCTSAAGPFRQAFQTAKAGTYVGWNALSGSESGDRFVLMFDRLLGANVEPPLSTPLERSFDIDRVEEWMQSKGYDIDNSPQGTAQLQFAFLSGAKSLMLRPTLMRVIYEANNPVYNKTKFLLEGTFGPDPGPGNRKVMWGTRELDVLSWDELNGILVKLGPAPYPQGYIQVIRGVRVSNSVPMTEWTLPVTYTLNGKGTLKYVVTMNLKFRADVRQERFFPEDPLRRHPVAIWFLDDCTGQVTASGLYKPDANTTITWSGGSALTSVDSAPPPVGGILFGGDVNVLTGSINQMYLSNSGTFTQKTNGKSTTLTSALAGYLTFAIPLNKTSYLIPAGSVAPATDLGVPYAVSASLTWTAASPVNPPTDSTPR